MNKIIFGIIVISGVFMLALVIKNFAGYKRKKELPLTGLDAVVVAKRSKAKGFGGDRDYTRSFMTSYFITFQFNSTNERQEFRVQEKDYGLIAEGDEGTLWHQGNLFSRFDRK